MKRLALLCLVSLPAFGLTPLLRGNRIGVLRMTQPYEHGPERVVARTIGNDLTIELSSRGFKAFQASVTFDDAQRGGAPAADYYVEIVSSDAYGHQVGAVAAGVGPVVVDVGVVVSRVAAELRLYDGRTLELLERYDLRQSTSGILPTGVGLGTRSFFGFFMLPFVQYGQYRSAAHQVAREAADRIANR